MRRGPGKRLLAATALLLVAGPVAGCAPRDGSGGRVDEVSVPAPSLAGSLIPNAASQPARVVLPASYGSSDRSYPTIYFLPGFTTDVAEYFDGAFQGLDLRRVMAGHCARHPEAEAILVVVNGRNSLGGSFYANSPVTGRWEDYVVSDVVPWIDARYRTVRDRDARLLAGEGMGGFGALSIAMCHPEVFGEVYAISPEVFDDSGLDDQGMLSRAALRKAWRIEQARMASWPRADAPKRLVRLLGELYAADSRRFNYARGFAYAYGAAFAPDTGGPPFTAYPLRETAEGTVVDSARGRLWEDGYGGWEGKIARHRAGLRSLRGVGIDVGRQDAMAWVPRGARKVARLLWRAGIAAELIEHDGGHWDRLEERIERGLLPFFTRTLTSRPGDGGRGVEDRPAAVER